MCPARTRYRKNEWVGERRNERKREEKKRERYYRIAIFILTARLPV